MGATTFRKRRKKRVGNSRKTLRHRKRAADADIVVTHASLEGRVKRVTDKTTDID